MDQDKGPIYFYGRTCDLVKYVTKKSDLGEVVVSFMEICSYIFMQVGFEFANVVCIVKIWQIEQKRLFESIDQIGWGGMQNIWIF